MKKLLLVVAVGCSLSSITSAALAEGRQGPPHWPPPDARGEAQETDASAASGGRIEDRSARQEFHASDEAESARSTVTLAS